ncbi:hypothetical protein [Phytohabitans kaempferiae]|uniref:Bacterial mobilisation domain-containing protein n=1 Tax=Phytohabitans kaempferiae TaxID=1620943 RepID=A0ABV6MDK8_9ACTN
MRRINPSFSDDEYTEVLTAARRAGLTPTGYCAEAALVAARNQHTVTTPAATEHEALAELQAELFDARTAVNRVGGNLNQAVAALNSVGKAPAWLHSAVATCVRTVQALDEVVSAVHRRLR